jgi:hypothetical protein
LARGQPVSISHLVNACRGAISKVPGSNKLLFVILKNEEEVKKKSVDLKKFLARKSSKEREKESRQ